MLTYGVENPVLCTDEREGIKGLACDMTKNLLFNPLIVCDLRDDSMANF